MRKLFVIMSVLISGILLMQSCETFEPSSPADDELLDGPLEGLTTAQTAQFLAGDIAFNDEVFTRESGLGPIFVTNSCGSCHPNSGSRPRYQNSQGGDCQRQRRRRHGTADKPCGRSARHCSESAYQ